MQPTRRPHDRAGLITLLGPTKKDRRISREARESAMPLDCSKTRGRGGKAAKLVVASPRVSEGPSMTDVQPTAEKAIMHSV